MKKLDVNGCSFAHLTLILLVLLTIRPRRIAWFFATGISRSRPNPRGVRLVEGVFHPGPCLPLVRFGRPLPRPPCRLPCGKLQLGCKPRLPWNRDRWRQLFQLASDLRRTPSCRLAGGAVGCWIFQRQPRCGVGLCRRRPTLMLRVGPPPSARSAHRDVDHHPLWSSSSRWCPSSKHGFEGHLDFLAGFAWGRAPGYTCVAGILPHRYVCRCDPVYLGLDALPVCRHGAISVRVDQHVAA